MYIITESSRESAENGDSENETQPLLNCEPTASNSEPTASNSEPTASHSQTNASDSETTTKKDTCIMPKIQLAVFFSCVIATLTLSSRLVQTSCFKGKRTLITQYIETGIYILTIFAVFLFLIVCFCKTKQISSKRRDVNATFDFNSALTIGGMILLCCFPLLLFGWKINFIETCSSKFDIENSNTSSSSGELVAEKVVSACAGICVIFVTVFIIVNRIFVFTWPGNWSYAQGFILLLVSLSVMVLWTSSLASEVSEHSTIQYYKDCHNRNFGKYCRLKENRLASASSYLTPLVIEFCIMSLFALVELWQEMDRHNQNNEDESGETENRGTSAADLPRSDSPEHQSDTNYANTKWRIFLCLGIFFVLSLFTTILLFIELNNISEAASSIPEQPAENSVYKQSHRHLFSTKLFANVTNKGKCKRDNVSTISLTVDEYISEQSDLHDEIEIYVKTTTFVDVACAIIMFVLWCELRKLVENSDHLFSVSDIIIITTCSAVIGYLTLSIAGDIYCLCDYTVCNCLSKEYYAWELVANVTNSIQFLIQGYILLRLERSQFDGYVRENRGRCCKILPGLLWFLFVVNALRWYADSFYEMKSENDAGYFQIQSSIYGKRTWHLITQMFYPLAVYFRFHSAVLFLKAFYHTWLD